MSTTTLATQRQDQNLLSLEQAVDLYLRNTKTKGGKEPNQGDKLYFTQTCLAHKLNPFKRQAHLVGYDGKDGPVFSVITGIDGYRSIAHRTGLYAGRDQTKFAFTKDGKIFSATVTVSKLTGGQKVPYTATVFYDEAVQTNYKNEPNAIWSKRPKGQLDKCAEALALRMAFPDDLGGLYTDAEIDPEQEVEGGVDIEATVADPSDIKQQQRINILVGEVADLMGKDKEELKPGLYKQWRIESSKELTNGAAKTAIEQLLHLKSKLENKPANETVDSELFDDKKPTTNP